MTTSVTPVELAEVLRPVLDGGLFGFDVDGVLSPIVEHAQDSRLLPGTRGRLAALSEYTSVIVLSGRSLDDLERLFHFPTGLHVVGSHGLEARDTDPMQLDAVEQERFDALEQLGRRAVEAAGEGAWLEYKPASVVVHTRSADPSLATTATEELVPLATAVDGAHVKGGSQVVELMARRASKGDALMQVAAECERSPVVFFGDDLTDEDAFAMMGDDDVSVRVGPGETRARYRVDDPAAVAQTIAELV